jgi:single-strand DNA-binding protein
MNRIKISGNLGKDAEIRTGKDTHFTTFSVADNNSWRDKSSGEKRTHTNWFNCIANGKMAADSAKLRKGDRVELVGEVRFREYEKNGAMHLACDVRVLEVRKASDESDESRAEAPDSDTPF